MVLFLHQCVKKKLPTLVGGKKLFVLSVCIPKASRRPYSTSLVLLDDHCALTMSILNWICSLNCLRYVFVTLGNICLFLHSIMKQPLFCLLFGFPILLSLTFFNRKRKKRTTSYLFLFKKYILKDFSCIKITFSFVC